MAWCKSIVHYTFYDGLWSRQSGFNQPVNPLALVEVLTVIPLHDHKGSIACRHPVTSLQKSLPAFSALCCFILSRERTIVLVIHLGSSACTRCHPSIWTLCLVTTFSYCPLFLLFLEQLMYLKSSLQLHMLTVIDHSWCGLWRALHVTAQNGIS